MFMLVIYGFQVYMLYMQWKYMVIGEIYRIKINSVCVFRRVYFMVGKKDMVVKEDKKIVGL